MKYLAYQNLNNQLNTLEELYKKSLTSKLTAELEQLDKLRESILIAIRFTT